METAKPANRELYVREKHGDRMKSQVKSKSFVNKKRQDIFPFNTVHHIYNTQVSLQQYKFGFFGHYGDKFGEQSPSICYQRIGSLREGHAG